MFETQLFIRVMRASRRHLRFGSTSASDRCVKAVRHYLAQSYPTPDSAKILQIIARSGVDRIPLELLIDGLPGDRSSAGASHSLVLAVRGGPLGYGDPHPLFSSAFYSLKYTDVAAAEVSPWVHYQVFGHREARSPHPLLDPAFMRQWIPGSSPLTIVDTYLSSPEYWTIDTSPYLDTQRFILESETDGLRPPIMRILASDAPEAWLGFKLMLIDAASPEAAVARLNAAAFLVARHANRAWQRQLVSWNRGGGQPDAPTAGGRFTVVPGYFLGQNETVVSLLGEDAASPDLTMLRLETEYLSLTELSWLVAERLIFVRSGLDRGDAEAILSSGSGGALVVAPSSLEQEAALAALAARLRLDGVIILPFGQQANVESEALAIVDREPGPVEAWEWSAKAEAGDVLFVIPPGRSIGENTVESIDEWLTKGSSLLTADPAGFTAWSHLLDRSHVVVHPGLIEYVRPLVAEGSLRMLVEGQS
jgi:hypothetical protein